MLVAADKKWDYALGLIKVDGLDKLNSKQLVLCGLKGSFIL